MIRNYILSAAAMFVAAKAGELLLPDGNMKKYASVCISLILCISLIRPFFGKTNFKLPEVSEKVNFEDTFKKDVFDEYKKRIESNIFEKCGVLAEVSVGENGVIESIALPFGTSADAVNYIISELGVEKDVIKIAENK